MACDLNLVGLVILYRMVPSMMSAFEFVGFAVQRQSQIWCPRQIPKIGKPQAGCGLLQWHFPLRQDHRGRWKEKHHPDSSVERLQQACPRDDGDVDSQCCHQPQNVTFDTEIVCHDFQGTPSVSAGQK